MRNKLVLALAVLTLIAACGGQRDPRDGAATRPAEKRTETKATAKPREVVAAGPERELTAWERITAGIEADGTVPKAVALQAFALTMAPLPGVTVPEGEVTIESGSASLRWMSRYIDDVTPEQRAAIETALKPDAAIPTTQPSSSGALGSTFRSALFDTEYSCTVADHVGADGVGAAEYRPLLDAALAQVEAALGETLTVPVYLTLGTSGPTAEAVAWASPQSPDCAERPATSCRTELNLAKLEGQPAVKARIALAHELVHCFQATWMPAKQALNQPDWITEGFPDFVGNELNPGGKRTNLNLYASAPDVPLFERDYEAQGFFFHLLRVGGDPYGRYHDAFVLRNSSDAFASLIKGTGDAFADTWASVLTDEPERGDAWFMPDVPDASAFFKRATLGNGRHLSLSAAPAATRLAHLEFDTDVVRFTVSSDAHGRVGWDGAADARWSEVSGVDFCARSGGCECPPGTGPAPQTRIPSEGAMVTVAGTTAPTHAEFTGVSLDDYCKVPCIVGDWTSRKWTLPGPAAALNATGGEGARISIHRDGSAEWDFDGMKPLAMHDPQVDLTTTLWTTGSATARIAFTSDGSWKVGDTNVTGVKGRTELSIGGTIPSSGLGAFVLLVDGSYTCTDDLLSYSTIHPTTGKTVSILMARA